MVDVTTSEAIAVRLSANDTVLEGRTEQDRRRRIHVLREAIDRGEYRVPAGELADAILRTAHRSN